MPLHSAPVGMKFGRFDGKDIYATSERLIRLPMYYGLNDISHIVSIVKKSYQY